MKKTILIIAFTFFGLSSKAQSCPIQLSLKGRIVNRVDLGKECGYLKLASVIELEIIEFSDYGYQQKTIGIIVRCPEMYGENYFEVNQVYQIMAEKQIKDSKSDFEYEVQNAEVLKKYSSPSSYWALPGNLMRIQ